MKILFLTPQLPHPPHQGTTIRNFNLIRHLAPRHTIDLVSFLAPGQSVASSTPLQKHCRQIVTISQPERSTARRLQDMLTTNLPDMALRLESAAMRGAVGQLGNTYGQLDYDIVQIEGIEMAQYGLQVFDEQSLAKRPQLVFDDHNCEYLLQKRNALTDLRSPSTLGRWLAGGYSLIQWGKLRAYEAAICRRADVVLAVSEPDQRALEALVPGIDVTVIPNGINPADYQPSTATLPRTDAINLLFTGKMDYRPNIDAALWFGEQVFPLIQAEEPRARFQIVGMNPHPRLDRLRKNPAIVITGAVESIPPYLADAAVYAVPLRVGGGTRFKVLEAMAQGLPLVSTTLGVEGLGVTDGRELLMADTPEMFASAVLRVVTDRQAEGTLTTALGNRARTFVSTHYSWEQIVPQLELAYQGQ